MLHPGTFCNLTGTYVFFCTKYHYGEYCTRICIKVNDKCWLFLHYTTDYTVDSGQLSTIMHYCGKSWDMNSWLRLMSSFVSNCHLNLSLYFPVCVAPPLKNLCVKSPVNGCLGTKECTPTDASTKRPLPVLILPFKTSLNDFIPDNQEFQVETTLV
jgi:hypothetical protein